VWTISTFICTNSSVASLIDHVIGWWRQELVECSRLHGKVYKLGAFLAMVELVDLDLSLHSTNQRELARFSATSSPVEDLDPICSHYGTTVETTIHFSFQCDSLNSKWKELNFCCISPPLCLGNLPSKLWEVLIVHPPIEYGKLITLLWSIWCSRSLLVFKDTREDWVVVWAQAAKIPDEFHSTTHLTPMSSPSRPIMGKQWKPSPKGVYKLNLDDATELHGAVCFSFVVRNYNCDVLACGSTRMEMVCDSVLVEALALRFGITTMLPLGFLPLLLETDASQVVQEWEQPNPMSNEVGMIINDVKEVAHAAGVST
ncbi:hypothetical protein Ancab_014357, partial [Ancistrocladus abbreviatus]